MGEYCEKCPRRDGTLAGHPGAVPGWGRLDAPVLVVGMSPGKDELLRGEPFVGASGALLRNHGAEVGLFREDCRIVNTSMCWPCGPKAKTLSKAQLSACRPGLVEQLERFEGSVVLCLGADAFEAVTGLIGWEQGENKRAVKGMKGPNGESVKAKPVGIAQWRGYCVTPSDCPGVMVKRVVLDHEDLYKAGGVCPACKGSDEILSATECDYCNNTGKRVKGQPKLKTVELEVPRSFGPNVQWIIGTFHPSFIMRTGMKVLPAFINDVGRAVRATRGELDLVKVEYEERLPPQTGGAQ